ncbi:MAG: diacylglycerol kinase family lipid kinase [Calditrichia bacterium]
MLVFYNPHACEGRAKEKLERVAPLLKRWGEKANLLRLDQLESLNGKLRKAMEKGDGLIVAAGGDGTVHHVVNYLLRKYTPNDLKKITLGAIGLGSSNDFHKPIQSRACFRGIPITLNKNQAVWRDVVRVRYREASGNWSTRYFLINASCGITAQANWLFNHPDKLLHLLKKTCTQLAILYAAFKTILTFKGLSIEAGNTADALHRLCITNLALVKSTYCSGSFCYDSPFDQSDGSFWIHTCLKAGRMRVLRILWNLAHHRFRGQPATQSQRATRFTIKGSKPFALEMDGEVVEIWEASFEVLPGRLRVCQQ